MTPKPWSFSSLSDFKNCPRSYYEKRIAKSVKEEETEHTIWGTTVHKAFEDRQGLGTPLPDDLIQHEDYMRKLDAIEGDLFCERKVALGFDRRPVPLPFDWSKVWWNGVIDWTKVNRPKRKANIRDYKTGKQKSDFSQLRLFSLYLFAEYDDVDEVNVRFYWTQSMSETGETYYRKDIKKLWAQFIPDLRQYMQAFKEDTWQPRQSGLCYGWCPVTQCEFWKPKKRR